MNIDAQSLFRALADQTRLRCMVQLALHEELCVCELTHALGLAQPKISHHLGNLRKAGLVSDRKAGLWVYYQVNPELPAWCVEVVHTTAQGLIGEQPFAADAVALGEMPNRPDGVCSA